MSESAATLRPLSGAEEFDRRIRSITQAGPVHSDAFAELARFVEQQDPFGPQRAVSAVPVQSAPAVAETTADNQQDVDPDFAAFDAEFRGGLDSESKAPMPAVRGSVTELQAWERVVPRFPSISVRDPQDIEPSPDVWAQGVDEVHDDDQPDAPTLTATREEPPVDPGSPKRTLVVLAAVIVLTAGGLGASFLARPSASARATATATPTIMAASGPNKVQPETPATGEDAPSEPSKLLDKNKNDGTTEAKIVNSVEQPVDLGQAMKPAAADVTEPAPPAPASPFPEPRKVKTILVRPDGSIIADAAPVAPDSVPSAANQQASLAFDPTTALPVLSVSQPPVAEGVPTDTGAALPPSDAPKPPAGKSTTRATAAKPAASTTQDGSAAAQARTNVATPRTKPVVRAAKTKPKPVAAAPAEAAPDAAAPVAADAPPPAVVADATPTASVDKGGAFAIQLGAAPTEAEGQATAARLAQKYSGDLGGASPSVRKAEAGGRTVYRIRVGNLSQDAAKALCSKVQAGGGGCFVARN